MQRLPSENFGEDYYLQVVKRDEQPQWPKPAKELLIGSQMLDSGFVQYWAYPKEAGKYSDEFPPAEIVASENQAARAVIIIDQAKGAKSQNELISLILAKNGHAWAKTETSLENLEDNLNSLVEFARDKFDINIEHFLTTSQVSEEVEKALDEIDGGEVDESRNRGNQESDLTDLGQQSIMIKKSQSNFPKDVGAYYAPSKPSPQTQPAGNQENSSGSKLALGIPVLILLLVVIGAFLFKGQVLSKVDKIKQMVFSSAPTPTPLAPLPSLGPTASPTPAIDRSKYKIRVLNGTLQSGAASTLASQLQSLGWQVIKVGNADNNNTPISEVNVKKNEEVVGSVLVADLTNKLQASVSASLTSSDKADAEVIIGKQ